MSPSDPLLGQVLNRAYRILSRISEGGMSMIYEAERLRIPRRRVAVKMLHPAAAGDEELRARFLREAEILAEVSHPHLVQLLDTDQSAEGQHYHVMELLPGETLRRRLERDVRLDAAETLELVQQVGGAVAALHQHQFVHRDLIPENIFLVDHFEELIHVRVMDLNLGLWLKQRPPAGASPAVGTPGYMAPEQACGQVQQIGPASDVFALAAVVYEVLCGSPAFGGADSDEDYRYLVCNTEPTPITARAPELPRELQEVLGRGMARAPADRQPSMEALVEQLRCALSGAAQDTVQGFAVTAGEVSDPTPAPDPHLVPGAPPPDLPEPARPPASDPAGEAGGEDNITFVMGLPQLEDLTTATDTPPAEDEQPAAEQPDPADIRPWELDTLVVPEDQVVTAPERVTVVIPEDQQRHLAQQMLAAKQRSAEKRRGPDPRSPEPGEEEPGAGDDLDPVGSREDERLTGEFGAREEERPTGKFTAGKEISTGGLDGELEDQLDAVSTAVVAEDELQQEVEAQGSTPSASAGQPLPARDPAEQELDDAPTRLMAPFPDAPDAGYGRGLTGLTEAPVKQGRMRTMAAVAGGAAAVLFCAGLMFWCADDQRPLAREATPDSGPAATASQAPASNPSRLQAGSRETGPPPGPPRPTRLIKLSSAPPGADVHVAGRRLGQTPLQLLTATNTPLTFDVTLPGHHHWRRVVPSGSEELQLVARLRPLPPGRPPPGENKNPAVGRVVPGQPGQGPPGAAAPAARKRASGALRVGTVHAGAALWANIYVDGRPVGQTPLALEQVSAGTHLVEARRRGYRTTRKRVTIRPGGRASVLLELHK